MSIRRRYIDRHGRSVDDHEALDGRGCVKDGYGVRVALTMTDARHRMKTVHREPFGRELGSFETEVERDDEDDRGRRDDAALSGAALALHRPGYRASTRVNDDAAVEAYRQYIADQANAWKKRNAQPPPGAYPLSAGVGTACSINGAPGVLVESDDGQWLVCKPASRQDG